MGTKIETIQDEKGDVWTGSVVDKSPSLGDVAISALFLGIPLVADLTRDTTTVKVNGEEHTGKKI
jgi:hypothetical protein